MDCKRVVAPMVLAVFVALLLSPATASALTYDKAVDRLFDSGYPQTIETYLNSLGTSPLGFRLGGTAADDQAARYIAVKLRAAGYRNVRLEPVPVDEWAVRGASLTVAGRKFICSQFAGVPGTDADGVTAEIVYVGPGTASDYDGLDVRDKIVLVDSSMDNIWFNFQGAEATLHGAKAVVLTSNASDPAAEWPSAPWYTVAPDALGGNDGEYDRSFVPLVYLSQCDGDWLKATLAADGDTGLEVTLASRVDVTMAGEGGLGYNVIATLPGRRHDGQMVIWDAHHDAHFRPGLDDTGAVAATLTAAKAMKMSGYRPNRTIVFMFDTAEEFGYTDCWYDWSVGAWHFITHRHPDWAGRIAAMWSIELMAAENATVDFNTSPELVPWIEKTCADNPALTPYGVNVETPQSTWQNGWSFMACGVPSFEISAGGPDYDAMYHSTYENYDVVDWDMLANITKLFRRLNDRMDTHQLPYDFVGRADDLLSKHLDTDELEAAGVPAAKATGLERAARRLRSTARRFGATRQAVYTAPGPASRNPVMLKVAKRLLKGMTALDAWDYTAYPHEQTMWDIEYMDEALAALSAAPVDAPRAVEALTNVGLNWNGALFSPSVYRHDLTRHDPDYPRITWGKLGKLPIYFDMTNVMQWIDDGQYTRALERIEAMRSVAASDLTARVGRMTKTIDEATAIMRRAM